MISLFKRLKNHILLYLEYEKAMSDLQCVVNYNIEDNIELSNLVYWFRNEYYKRPEKYTGDHVPINLVRRKVMSGYLLHTAIKETKKELAYEFNIMDKLRCIAK